MKLPWKRRLLAVLLMLIGSMGMLAVFWLLPYQARSYDLEWMTRHTELAQWEYTQNYIRRFSWRHDDFDPVGKYGGKKWAEWIIERLPDENDPESCSGGHKISALESITNFSPNGVPGGWPKDLPLWQTWWEQNRDKTQEQWIVDGFTAMGVVVHNPPAKEDWPALLKLLGHVNPEQGETVKAGAGWQPAHLNFNAFRCLRDSGFDPVHYALEAEITPEIKAGLLEYRRREKGKGYWDDPPGRLFGVNSSLKDLKNYLPHIFSPAFRWGWGSAFAVAFAAGVWLWWRRPAPPVPSSQ